MRLLAWTAGGMTGQMMGDGDEGDAVDGRRSGVRGNARRIRAVSPTRFLMRCSAVGGIPLFPLLVIRSARPLFVCVDLCFSDRVMAAIYVLMFKISAHTY